MAETILEVNDLHTWFGKKKYRFGKRKGEFKVYRFGKEKGQYKGGKVIRAVEGLSYTLNRGEALAIVGESGSGKSVGVSTVMGLTHSGPTTRVTGRVTFKGQDLLNTVSDPKEAGLFKKHAAIREKEFRAIRGDQISMIFQDPMSSLNPTMKIGRQIVEPLLWHKGKLRQEIQDEKKRLLNEGGKEALKAHRKDLRMRNFARARGLKLLEEVGIPSPETRFNNYPFEFSGGMRQRVMIAMALIGDPDLLIADEPTTALDVTVQAQILSIIQKMRKRKNTSIILITHDLAVASSFCDRVIVMYAGRVMEEGSMADFIRCPAHPYSQGLLNSTPILGDERARLEAIQGQPPDPRNLPSGCPFSARCTKCMELCTREAPPKTQLTPGHNVYCWLCAGEKVQEKEADING